MGEQWYHFHSALEALAGVNVGLFAFEKLCRPAIETEADKWAFLRDISSRNELHLARVLEAEAQFHATIHGVVEQTDAVRGFCGLLAALAIILLLRATYLASEDAEPFVAWPALIAMCSPPVIFLALNCKARTVMRTFAERRTQLERDII